MMRVIAGTARGRAIKVAARSRPYLAKTRGAIFNALLQHIPDANVLDLYAGSGINAIEAISRGAAKAVLVENSRDAIAAINENIRACGFAEIAEVRPQRVEDFLRAANHDFTQLRFDLIFIDPPFAEADSSAVAQEIITAGNLLTPFGRLVFRREIDKRAPLPIAPNLRTVRDKIYGRSQVIIYEHADQQSG